MTDGPKPDGPRLSVRQLKVLDSMRDAIKAPPVPLRSCGDCAKCCEGWVAGAAYGHPFSPGNPCFFLEKTCSIYAERPMDPCQNYRCGWLSEDIFPMWMKPNLVNLVISKRAAQPSGLPYYVVDMAGETVDQRALRWLASWATTTGANVEYRLDGVTSRSGAPDFVNE